MPWWMKSTSKDGKRDMKKQCFIDALHRKFKNASEGKGSSKSKVQRTPSFSLSDKFFSVSRSEVTSAQVSRCQSFAENTLSQPLPIPGGQNLSESGNSLSEKSESCGCFKPFPSSSLPQSIPHKSSLSNTKNAIATTSALSESKISSDGPVYSHPQNDEVPEIRSDSRKATPNPSGTQQTNLTTLDTGQDHPKPLHQFLKDAAQPTTSPQGLFRLHLSNLQIPAPARCSSTPTSMRTSPCRSPVKLQVRDPVVNMKPYFDLNSLSPGTCSSPCSMQTSGYNSVDMFSPTLSPGMTSPVSSSRVCSPRMSPRMMSPGPSSRVQSGDTTPINTQGGEVTAELQTGQSHGRYLQSHQLPVPPIRVSGSSPFSTSSSAVLSPKSSGRLESALRPVRIWKKGRLLGRGTFGHVYLGFSSETGEMCAMKEVMLFSDDAKSKECAEQLEQELALLSHLRHPNVVQYYGSEKIDEKLYIYLEYVSGGSIHKLLQDYGPLGESAIRSYTRQILSGLQYLHAENTVHRDIKGANILVEPSGVVKLADFGMAKHMNGQSCSLSFKGSPYWMAPEVVKNSKGCNFAVDIWSLGCTVIEMATAKPPWCQYEGIPALFKIGNSKELPSIPAHLSEEGKDFVRKCLQRNPHHRLNATQLLEHPFVRSNIAMVRPTSSSLTVSNTVRSKGYGHVRESSRIPIPFEGVAKQRSADSLPPSVSRDAYNCMRKNISCPVSPISSRPVVHRKPAVGEPRKISAPLRPAPAPSGCLRPGRGGGATMLCQPVSPQLRPLSSSRTFNSHIFNGASGVSYLCKQTAASVGTSSSSNRNQFTWPVNEEYPRSTGNSRGSRPSQVHS